MRSTLLALSLALVSCGSDEPEQDVEASRIWTMVNRELHRVHVAHFGEEGDFQAETVELDCKDGGSMTMVVTLEPFDLLHDFNDCQVGDNLINGEVDYTDLRRCEENPETFSFEVGGTVTVDGPLQADACSFIGAEICGISDGKVCGQSQ